jgi:hypothetical protein
MEERQAETGFLVHCVAETTGNPLLEEIRDRSAEAALAVFRVAKNSLVHAIENDAMVQCAEQSTGVLTAFAGEIGTAAAITFIDDTVFVCGQLLRASRKIYEATQELGKLLFRAGVSEVSFEATLTTQNMLDFAAPCATPRGATPWSRRRSRASRSARWTGCSPSAVTTTTSRCASRSCACTRSR